MNDWKKHSIVILVYLVISTPLTYILCFTYPQFALFIESFTNTTNNIALVYAVFIFYIYDKNKSKAIEKAKNEGLEVPELDIILAKVYKQIKKFDEWHKKNEKQLENLNTLIEKMDFETMIKNIDKNKKRV